MRTIAETVLRVSVLLAFAVAANVRSSAAPQTTSIAASDAATAENSSSTDAGLQTSFEIRFQEFGNVYLRLKPGAVLEKGMKLVVRRRSSEGTSAAVIGVLRVKSVSATSAICEVISVGGDVERGDIAYLTVEEAAQLSKREVLTAERRPSLASPKSESVERPTAASSAEQQSAAANPAQGVAKRTAVLPDALPRPPAQSATASAVTANPPMLNPQPATSAAVSGTQQAKSQAVIPIAPIPQTQAIAQTTPSPNIPPLPRSAQAQTQPKNLGIELAKTTPGLPASPKQPEARHTAAELPDSPKQPDATAIAKNVDKSEIPAARAEVNSGGAKPSQTAAAATDQEQEAQMGHERSVADVQTVFKIKFVAEDTVYLNGGTATGLTAGMKLTVKHSELDMTEKGTLAKASQAPAIAELEVISVASSSAVCSVKKNTAEIQPGDLALMDEAAAQSVAQKRELSATRTYPQVVSFNEGDPLEEEVREEVPRPPLPEVNRLRGRIGFDYSNIRSVGSVVSNNSQIGMVLRTDFTRIGGTYWNMSGYWRGRFTNTSYVEQPTLQDLMDRTYHLNLSYSNPMSPWVAGVGRLYLPWASSLDTLDGGYFGRKAGKHLLLGLFAGSTPDPTSWDYNPDRRIGGVFLNLEGGSFDSLRVTSTSGVALSTLKWQIDRPFIFFENGLYFKRYISIYDSTQADDPRPLPGLNAAGPGLSRNFFTLRFQPFERISFDVDHNYFRDVPTFDTVLIATGLLDKYLFQGLSGGARIEPIRHISFYASVGQSSRTGDTSASRNQMYGVTLGRIPWTGLRLDVRRSRFNSSFGNGKYDSVSLSRNVTDALRLEIQGGQQYLSSQLSSQTRSRFVNASLEGNLGRNYFVQGAYTLQRGGTFDYNQWTVTFGYRFDNHMPGVAK